MNLATIDQAAEKLSRSPATIRNYIKKGKLSAYRTLPGPRGYQVDLDEVEKVVPPKKKPFGPNAKIIYLDEDGNPLEGKIDA